MPNGGDGGPAPRGVQAPPESIVEGVRWLCVTGLVPYQEQREKFDAEFNSAHYSDPLKDDPCWITFLVERAEVPPADAKGPKKWKWEKISVNRARDFAATWALRAGDVVDPAYIDENLTFPLGPMLGRNWGKEVTHSKIPLLDLTQRGAMSAGTTPAEPDNIADADKKTEDDEITVALKKRQEQMKMGNPGMSAPRTVVSRTPGAAAMRSNLPRGDGSEGRYSSRVRRTRPQQSSGGGEAEPQVVEYLLFRFFDFTVEEGKRYSYRVQLVLANPNEDIRPQYLKDASLAKASYKLSPVSEPSPVASVSGYNYLLAGKVKAADKPIDEPKVSMIAVQLDPKLGTKAAYEMRPRKPGSVDEARRPLANIERGQVIKFNANVHMVHPITRHVEKKDVAFNSNMVLLDIKGGELFTPGSLKDHNTMPGEVLLMDCHAALHSQSEAADESDYAVEEQYIKLLEEAERNNTPALSGGLPAQ